MIPCSGEEYFYKIDNLLLSSCQTIRALVRTRWKRETGEEWIDGENQGTEFIRICGQIYKQSQRIQKGMIVKGCLEEWDLSLLSNVLQNFGDSSLYKNENDAVRALTRMRNDLAHHPNKKLSLKEYNDKISILKTNLLVIGLSESDIDKTIEKAGITSSIQAMERVMKVYVKASSHEKEGNFEAAVECYTDAIATPSLLPVNQGVAFEKRASCYLKMARPKNTLNISENDLNLLRQQAMLDAKEALELNENSWKAHYLVAQCHRLDNNLKEAIHHYHRALAISPVQKLVKTDLDVCKVLSSSQQRHDHLNPGMMPMNLTERLAHLENETGLNLSEEQFLKMNNSAGMFIKGQDHVARGHQYSCGWNVIQDHAEAARHYAKAAQVGNPEGIFNLGLSYIHGKGLVRDVSKAFEYFTQAAQMPTETRGLMTSLNKNVAVAAAQHNIGLMYDYGIHVEQNYVSAIDWYSKAADNGIGNAANNLGCMYFNGIGVNKNEKLAEMYWNQGVILKDVNAVASLMLYYITHLEPEKARTLFETGKELGHHGFLNMTKKDVDSMLFPAKLTRSDWRV